MVLRLEAVSNTHLDVYKRQVVFPAPGLDYGASVKDVLEPVLVQASVSYTHLDVYKRQDKHAVFADDSFHLGWNKDAARAR